MSDSIDLVSDVLYLMILKQYTNFSVGDTAH